MKKEHLCSISGVFFLISAEIYQKNVPVTRHRNNDSDYVREIQAYTSR